MHFKLGRKVLGALVSAAVMFSMIPGMAMAADATAVNAMVTSDVTYNNPVTIEGITISSDTNNNSSRIHVGNSSTRFELPKNANGQFTFKIDESGTYAGYVITQIDIGVGQVTNCTLPEASNSGWSALSSNNTLTWSGDAASSVSLTLHGNNTNQNRRVVFSSITVYVTVPPTSVSVTDSDGDTSGYAYVDDVIGLTATVAPEGTAFTAVTWSTDDTTGGVEIAGGVVSASAAGTYNITATVNGYSSLSATYVFSAYEHVSGATIDSDEETIFIGDTCTLTAAPTNEDNVRADDYTITWSSDDEEVATVSDGVVTPVATGEATITATITDNGVSPAVTHTATCDVTVCAHLEGISLDPSSLDLTLDSESTPLTVVYDPEVTDDNLEAPVFESSDEDVVTVSEAPAPVETVTMYRLYNPNSGEHFYTSDTAERDNLINLGWLDEGIAWYGASPLV